MENLPNRLEAVRYLDNQQPLQIHPIGTDKNAAEFNIPHCDHTVATLLAHELRQQNNIRYVAIRQPHPLEQSMLIRIQKQDSEGKVEEAFLNSIVEVHKNLDGLLEQLE
ncbi:RNA polymerase II subunit Rpb11 [Spironucleus salmonicida]|uniref:RNA polymerase II subunit Rpb11 n=1 Tax=Spironucleus salmonicida TaxID=348837 RepID=V6LBM3_9EUKA|nr:RNA polymerase II subunit Rpb11 [Spironucleus salmonicida]|eukprot:EST41822.1 RNA polymerase II subunit Rpb11 [Spironucleus salmonicida]